MLWCDTATNLARVVDRRLLREFSMRVAFQLPPDDSLSLIDTPAASRLGPHRALFYDEDSGRAEKLRPYSTPSEEWLTSVVREGVAPRPPS